MPTSEQILDGLAAIANQWMLLAVFWHVYIAAIAGALVLGMRPTRHLIGVALSVPLYSVSALAFSTGNLFNGIVFALVALTLTLLAVRFKEGHVQTGPVWTTVAGSILVAFGWVYPHFLETDSFLPYLYAAPTGLIPCPTLSVVIGLALVVGGLESRSWSLVLGAAGLFYGVFGVLRLGVALDWVLAVGALLFVLRFGLYRTKPLGGTPPQFQNRGHLSLR